jgi:hypothetical protein
MHSDKTKLRSRTISTYFSKEEAKKIFKRVTWKLQRKVLELHKLETTI